MACREIAGETLVVPIRRSVADLANIYSFNPVGDEIWQKLSDGPKSAEELASSLCEVFDVGQEHAIQDVICFREELAAEGLVSSVDENGREQC